MRPGNGEGAMTWDPGSNGRPSGYSFALGDNELDDWGPVPTQHGLHTLRCPSLARLLSTSAWGVLSCEEPHVATCPYCQKVLAMAWRYECPSVAFVVFDMADMSPAEAAIREHLEQDGCVRCQRLLRSGLVRSAAAALREGRRSLQSVEDWLKRTVVVGTRLPAKAGTFAASNPGPFRVRVESPGGLVTVVRQTDRGLLVLEVESADLRHEGKRVLVEILGEGEPLEVSLVLRTDGERCIARHTVGHLSDLAPRLGSSCEVLADLRDDNQPPS
jgi:hypothetical protein